MPLSIPPTPASICFNVEGSSDRQPSSGVAFTVENLDTATAQTPPKSSKTQLNGSFDNEQHLRSSQLLRLLKVAAPSPDKTSHTHSSPAASSSSSSRSETSSQDSHDSAPTSVSSTTHRTAIATTPSMSTSHPQLSTSRQASATVAIPSTRREVSAPQTRSPRVQAVLRNGGPRSRGHHSISPMAPDAARAPPLELQGPPRYLRAMGRTPFPLATAAARRHSSARRASTERSIPPVSQTVSKKRKGSMSRTLSPNTLVNGGDNGQRSRRDSKQHSRALVEKDDRTSTPSQSHRSHPHSHSSREKDHKHSHVARHNETENAIKQKKNKKIEKDGMSPKEVRMNGRGTVTALPFNTVDAFNTTAGDVAQQQQQQQLEWKSRNETNSLSFQSTHNPPTPQGSRFGVIAATAAAGGAAREAEIRAPPPRATSPRNRQQQQQRSPMGPIGTTIDRDGPRRLADGPSGNARNGNSSNTDADADVDLTVPVLSAHGRAGSAWLASVTRGDSGPPGPAAWTSTPRGGPGDAQTSKSCRYSGANEGQGIVEQRFSDSINRKQRRSSHVDAPSHDAVSPLSVQRPTSRLAPSNQLPSHRFHLPSSSTCVSAYGKGIESATAPPGGTRFSPSPQLEETSPIITSYVAQSFSSYLPGNSTLLGSGTATAFQKQQRAAERNMDRKQPLLKKDNSNKDKVAVGLEVAVLAEPAEELPSHDTLEHYEKLLRRYGTQQRNVGFNIDNDAASLFSLVVHITLFSPLATAASKVGAEASGEQRHNEKEPVTIGDVKDEVALRTGIPSAQQCLVYDAMSLQDSLPVHLLLTADDADCSEAEGHCLRLLCVPLTACAKSNRRWPKRPFSVEDGGSETRLIKAQGKDGEMLDDADDLTSLLLLSPPRHGMFTAQPTMQQIFPGSTTDAVPLTRRGAVPFTLSQSTVKTHTEANRAYINSAQHRDAPDIEQEAIFQHIDRLRRLYLGDESRTTAPAEFNTGGYSFSSTLLRPRDYLLNPAYQLNQPSQVQHADPVAHSLQQKLLLAQLTTPSTSSPEKYGGASATANGENTWMGTVPRTGNAPMSATLSSALMAALPAPPVRRSRAYNSGMDSHEPNNGLITNFLAPTVASSSTLSRQQPKTATATPAAAAAAATPPPPSSGATGPTRGSSISVLRRTLPSAGFYTQRISLPKTNETVLKNELGAEDGVGVRASWLESYRTSTYSAPAMDEAEVAMSQSPSTLDY